MPLPTKSLLESNASMLWIYVALWIDSIDYAFGVNELGRGANLPSVGNVAFAAQLTASADRELTASARLLTQSRLPSAKALETSRMATEMFLKAYLAVHDSLTEADAQKRYGHNLEKLVPACETARKHPDLCDLGQYVKTFPSVGTRYDGAEYDNQRLWSGYAVALRTAVTFTRSLTTRDSRNQIKTKQPSM